MLADYDARWGDYGTAADVLDGAEALQGTLPPEYQTKRRQWRAADGVGTPNAQEPQKPRQGDATTPDEHEQRLPSFLSELGMQS